MKSLVKILVTLSLLPLILVSCQDSEGEKDSSGGLGFLKMDPSHTGIDFSNDLSFDRNFNIYKYRNFYNGGGVSLGDINNDGLIDIYFTGNQKPNKLYLNKGDFKFEDITESAGVAGNRAWSTGVSMVDINSDGFLDIYVCNSGDVSGDNKQNEFYINNGDLTFTESAESYGIADRGYGTHAAFFDYDNDGDLDLYLLNNSYQAIGSFNLQKNERPKRDPEGGDKLFKNEGDSFVDVSEEAGIYGSIIGFGLGVTVGDFNKDGWQDIYVSNDFFERDYIYMNNQDGTFREELEKQMRSISAASMGADYADINNDGHSEFFVTEMLPEPDYRLKTVTTFESWDKYQLNIKNNYYHQFTRNMLHFNNQNDTYSEIGRLSGVHATDWSWGALIADFDNDGLKDIFVANGIYQDLTNQDYLAYISNEETMKALITDQGVDYKSLVEVIPSVRIPNYMYKNGGDLAFENVAMDWGLDEPSHSNGSAYGDLDNDGDLDLVVNNVNMKAFVYQNRLGNQENSNRYLKLILEGKPGNTFAVGSKVDVIAGDLRMFLEQMPIRGFQSSMDPRINFGVGNNTTIDTVKVEWPDGSISILTNLESNQQVVLKWADSQDMPEESIEPSEMPFKMVDNHLFDFQHKENTFVDFDRDRLLFHMRSTEGPKLAKADVNGDGLEDIYIGGAKDSPGSIFIQTFSGDFVLSPQPGIEKDMASEDVDAVFFDADNDGDMDLYVASGGSEFSSSSPALQDRLYKNDGTGNFSKTDQILPIARFIISSTVEVADVDGDGDIDLFVGTRMQPQLYGVPGDGYLLENDGTGTFTNITSTSAEGLQKLGLITDAVWTDFDNDGDKDLVVVGEYMPVSIFRNESGTLLEQDYADKSVSLGWWRSITESDLDGDGDMDYVLGNHGKNSRFKASPEKPIKTYVNDFDRNGTVEQIITTYNGDKAYTMALKHDLVMQMPELKKKYLKFESFKEQTINDIFTPAQLENAIVLEANNLSTSILLNNGNGQFQLEDLPVEAQFSPVYAIQTGDFDQDGNMDIVLGGNIYNVKPEVGRYDASYGLYLKGDGTGNFTSQRANQSGLNLEGQVRDFSLLSVKGKDFLLVARNNETLQLTELNLVGEDILIK